MITKKEFIKKLKIKLLKNNLKLSNKEIDIFLENFKETIIDELKNGNEVLISSFIKFKIKEQNERTFIRPITKEKIKLPKRKVIKIEPKMKLKNLTKVL